MVSQTIYVLSWYLYDGTSHRVVEAYSNKEIAEHIMALMILTSSGKHFQIEEVNLFALESKEN